jgi:hypothetical protein
VQHIPFTDHSAPSLKVLVEFCQQATAFLNKNPRNLIAIHCRGGKGRTGTLISALLRWCGVFDNSADCAHYYALRRTRGRGDGDDAVVAMAAAHDDCDDARDGSDLHGVDAPSQLAILRYLDEYMESRTNIFSPPQVIEEGRLRRGAPCSTHLVP